MSVVDPELRRREHDWLVSELAKDGIRVAQIEDLRDAANQTAESASLLLRLLPRVSEAILAHAIVIAIGRHRCTRAVVASLIEYWHRLGSISWEQSIYLHNHLILRSCDPLHGAEARRKAEASLSQAWYLSYEPRTEARLWASDASVPDGRTLSAYHDVQIKTGIGNALTWQARQELFDDIERVLCAQPHSAGRELLPGALVRCSSERAVPVLMDLLGDSGVGAHAMVELGRLAHEPARPYIEKFLEHPIDWVRREAKKALRRLDQAAGRGAATAALFEEVLPASERARGAKLVAGTGAKPRDIEGKVSAFVIGSLAEDERGWTRENCFATSVELDELESLFGKLAQKFKGDFRGSRGRALREEILQAEHEDWKAYKLNVRIGERGKEIWFHYFQDDPSTVELTFWGPPEFVAGLRSLLSVE